MATNYEINYEDERFKNVENEKQQQLNQLNETYNNMIGQSDDFYQRQIDAVRDYNTTQQDLQNQQTDLAINEINQAKDKAEKDYQREQRGAYSDWQKQSNRYGIEAERQAQNGMGGTGYSESSQVSMYNTYQNRVATARESYNLAVQNYDNKIAEARLANNSKLAEIAYQSLQQELELSLNGFQYKNTLLLDQINKQQEINNNYYTRWQNVLSQMNTENALAENIRQYNENLAENKRQYNTNLKYQKQRDKVADKHWKLEYNLSKKASSSSSGGSYTRTGKGGGVDDDELYAPKKDPKGNKTKEEKAVDEVSKKLKSAAKTTQQKFNTKTIISNIQSKYKSASNIKKNKKAIFAELRQYIKDGKISNKDAETIINTAIKNTTAKAQASV